MIQITHSQARRLIRQALDSRPGSHRLPDEQWMALQGHLESCPACRAYQGRLAAMEKDLRGALGRGWSGFDLPRPGELIQAVVQARRARVRRQDALTKLYLFGGALLLGLFFLFGPQMQDAEREPILPTATAEPTLPPTPTPLPDFRGLVAFESAHEGNPEIYLLNSGGGPGGPEVANLTQHPAADYAPAWSPDGEWLAFLSTRRDDAAGEEAAEEEQPAAEDLPAAEDQPAEDPPAEKAELFLVHLSGARLTQITDIPGIEWQPPITWSADGRYIALKGRRGDRIDDTGLYLVATDRPVSTMSGLRRLDLPQGAFYTPRFSPAGPLLAYGWNSGIEAWNVETDQPVRFFQQSLNNESIEDFQWDAGGKSLVYGVRSTNTRNTRFFFRRTREGRVESLTYLRVDENEADQADLAPNRVRSISPSPRGGRIAFLQDADGDECWTVHFIGDRRPVAAPRETPGLCVEGRLEPASWTPDGRWLVVVGAPPGQDRPGLYAVPAAAQPPEPPFERLADWPAGEEGAAPWISVRPSRTPLGIQAHAAVPFEPLPPTEFLPEIPGQLTYLRPLVGRSGGHELVTLSPGTLEHQAQLLPEERSDGLNCARWSPDGRHLAFVATTRVGNHLEITDAELNQVRRYEFAEGIYVIGTTCPAWAPDGSRVALIITNAQWSRYHLAIHGLAEGEDWFAPLEYVRQGWIADMEWSPDGRRMIMAWVNPPDVPSLLEWDLSPLDTAPAGGGPEGMEPLRGRTRVPAPDWTYLTYLAFSPGGDQLAVVGLNRIDAPQVRLLDAGSFREQARVALDDRDARYQAITELSWLPDGRLGIVRVAAASSLYPYEAALYDPATGETRTVLRTDLFLYNLLWSPNGNWLAYQTEGGLFLLDARTPHDPVKLLDGYAQLIAWR